MATMKVNEFLMATFNGVELMPGFVMARPRPHCKCADGYVVSIQASSNHYCSPRADGRDVQYEAVELGYPNQPDELILEYAEEPDSPCETVYGYVPVDVVDALCAKHGGIVGTA